MLNQKTTKRNSGKQERVKMFSTRLSEELIYRVKLNALKNRQSVEAFTTEAFERHIARKGAAA